MNRISGKVKISAIPIGIFIVGVLNFWNPFDIWQSGFFSAFAGTATTTVTVLNTPPQWVIDANEQFESSTSSPTNAGTIVSFTATAHDDNNESYYLAICKTSSTPTANSSAAPTCNGGSGNTWAISGLTASDAQAVASYTTSSTDPEENVWVGWICDGNAANPQCNPSFRQGSGTSSSPFYVNHRPTFTGYVDSSPADPGVVVTWFATSSDPDVFPAGATDTVRLWVCRAADFSGTSCGAGGTYCSSTLSLANPSCSSTLSSPLQDADYGAFGYIIDSHNLTSSAALQGSSSVLTVNNVAPLVVATSVLVRDTDDVGDLTLAVPQGETTGFDVFFTVFDNNSCSSTANQPEITSTTINVFRSGVGSSSCLTNGNYNPNNCYPGTLPTSTWNKSCSRVAGTCGGSSDPAEDWICTFPLWYVADPTDGADATSSQYFAENWTASAQAMDDDNATSGFMQSTTGTDMLSYLAYSLATNQIAYGSLSPGSSTNPLVATTTVRATGNVGLDHTLYADNMCTTYPTCSATSPTSTIQNYYQKYATSSVGYASSSAVSATGTPGNELEVNIGKTITTSSPTSGVTYWGILVSTSITLAGDYTGQNTIIGIVGEAQFW